MSGQRKYSMELRERATRMALEACTDFGRRRMRRSKRRPPRRKMLKMVCCGRGGLRFGHNVPGRVCCSRANPMLRAVTRYVACQPAIWSVGGAAQVRISGLTCGLEDPRA